MNKLYLYFSAALLTYATAAYAAPVPKTVAMPVASVVAENLNESTDNAFLDKATEKANAPKEKAAPARHIVKILLPTRRPGEDPADDVPVVDTDETIPLPPYPPHAQTSIGALQSYTIGEEDTLQDVARYFKLGFVELRAANPKVDPWTPVPGEAVTIPLFHLLPRAPQTGIVVNLAQMRLYYFKTPGKEPITFPIGIGREGLLTPTGETSIINKAAGPSWFPTARMREEKPYLPAVIGPGPSNPLGTHALYLGWPEYRIHGTDKPWAIGRRVSSGCIRMYPEDIKTLFNMVPVGTKVTVVDQPILVSWVGGTLYLEANPSKSQNIDIEINGEHQTKELTNGLRKVITDAAGVSADRIDWDAVEDAVEQRRGYPVRIGGTEEKTAGNDDKKESTPPPKAHHLFKSSTMTRYDYNR